MLYVKRLTATAQLPSRAYLSDAGLDLCADASVQIRPGERALISTGIAVSIDPGKVGLIWPRSGMAIRDGIDVGAGVIDAGYRGEVKVLLFNHGELPVFIEAGDRIAQLLIQPVFPDIVQEVKDLPPSHREAMGFGSSGR